MKIPRYIKLALNLLHKANYEAFIVGGAVRDYLLGIEPNDFDIATSALPEEIIQVFSKHKTLDIGIKHGTVGVLLYNKLVEITTYRVDDDYYDYRHPSTVKFVNKLKDDLSRRDFTINALAYNDQIIDYFGGEADLKKGIIKCVGDPDIRFTEDVLRILRALRFACQYNFQIEDSTKNSIFKHKHLISKISSERIAIELSKMLISDITVVLKPYFEVFQVIIPELSFDTIDEKINRLKNSVNNLVVRTAIILYDLKSPEHTLDYLKVSKKFKNQVMTIIQNKGLTIEEEPKCIAKLMSRFKVDDLLNIEAFHNSYSKKTNIRNYFTIVESYPKSTKDLNIKGNELISLGIKKSPLVAEILDELLNMVIDGKIENDNNILKEYIITKYL